MPTSGGVILLVEIVLAASDDSSFCLLMGSVVASAGSSTPSPLCGVHLSGGNKVFVDACIWDEFLVTAAVLERSTLASPPLF